MDEAFLLRARQLLDGGRTILDHRSLVENISERQAATPTARASAALNQMPAESDRLEGVSALILGSGDWKAEARRQGGCFNRAVAKRPVNRA